MNIESDLRTHKMLLEEERKKNRRTKRLVLIFQLTINLILIITYIDRSTEEVLSTLGVYNFVFPLIFIIFLSVGGQTPVIGASDFIPGLTVELVDTEGIEQKQKRVESLKSRFSEFTFFILLMFFGLVLYGLSWLI
jgi:uncharacterized integral membrane protein